MKRLLLLTAAIACLTGISPAASQGPEPDVQTFSSGDKAELVRTIPITNKRGAKSRVVMRVDAGKIGAVQEGDRFLAGAEVEVTTCLDGPSSHDICIGKSYPYDPHVAAKLVLTDNAGSTHGSVIGQPREVECAQQLPARNHHCVLVLPFRTWVASHDCTGCHVNLVMTAWRGGQADDGDQLVIGAYGSSGPIEQDKGRISLVRFRNGAMPSDTEPKLGNSRSHQVPIVGEGGSPKYAAIRSAKLTDLDPGDEIWAEGSTTASLSGKRYNALLSSKLYLARGRNALDHAGTSRYAAPDGQLAELNGFNCTVGRSDYHSPCDVPKLGVARIREHISHLYVILLMSSKAMENEANAGSWHSGDAAKVKGSALRVYVRRDQ